MSLPDQEARSMRRAWEFLLHLSSGEGIPEVTRQQARDIVRHFPLGGDLAAAVRRFEPELIKKVEAEADAPKAPPDHLNVP